jgi:hypothetical protein
MISDSSFVSSTMRFVKPLLTKTPFHPVTATNHVNQRIQPFGNIVLLTISSNNRVDSLKVASCIQFGTSNIISHGISETFCNAIEEVGIMDCSESFKILCSSWRESIIDFIARSPQLVSSQLANTSHYFMCENKWELKTHSISTSRRQSMNIQYRIIRRNRLESNISMP